MFNSRLKVTADNLLEEEQIGFRTVQSTFDALLQLFIENSINKLTQLLMVFNKAFESVNIEKSAC